MTKTNAVRALDKAGIAYELRSYDIDEADLSALGEASGSKRVEMVPLREVLDLTGYLRGAVTPLAIKRPFPVFIDETAELWPVVGISGGLRGLEILLAPADLIRVTGARLADIARQI